MDSVKKKASARLAFKVHNDKENEYIPAPLTTTAL
jgi:hypothetical protein